MTVTSTVPALRRVFQPDAVARGVVQVLKEEYKISDIGDATCPDGQVVEPGNSFSCMVQVSGKWRSVKIVVKSVDGEYEVGQPR
ncbi:MULTISPECIES: DUF4333 domain-containing protein [Lentzea]|uniref:DUF4333 domain-containing protein n=1 Tax=Lentzea TaxID=165301 RepID=UPI001473B10D|nr:DUF4333 domain-containing protein [Lentzea atacamensis]